MEFEKHRMRPQDLDIAIEDYADGSISDEKRRELEARMREDAALRERVETATQSVALLKKAILKVDPHGDFEDKVTSQIISITQSNPEMKGLVATHSGALTANDPDAKLLHDPNAERQRKRLLVLGIFFAVIFATAIAAILVLLR